MLTAVKSTIWLGLLGGTVAIALMARDGVGLGLFTGQSDVGKTPEKGSATFDESAKAYRVTGGGANMWFKEDAFHFVYKQITGDVALNADIAFEGEGKEPHRKAALMIRQNLEPDSAYADVAVHGDGLTSLQYRPSAGVDTGEFRLAMKAPKQVGIERRGNEITVWASDGSSKATNGPVVVSMNGPVYVGLAVCSHNANVLETADFSGLKLVTEKDQSQAMRPLQLMAKHSGEGLPFAGAQVFQPDFHLPLPVRVF